MPCADIRANIVSKQNMACVYIFRHGKENKFKIGRTKKSAKIRLKELQTGNPLSDHV